jgi:type IV pilus assembly protein PilX
MQIRSKQAGMALVTALLLLLVLTMLGVGMFRSFGLQEHIAGNTRERQRALHAASVAQSYAEWWLTANKGANAQQGGDCSGGVIQVTSTTPPSICTNALSNPTSIPWTNSASYTPPDKSTGTLTQMSTGAANAGNVDNYYYAPNFYIQWVSGFYDKNSGAAVNNYLVDANGYAGTTTAAAVVESSFTVSVTYTGQTNNTKFVNLGVQ